MALTPEETGKLDHVVAKVDALWDNRKVAPWQYKNVTTGDERDMHAVVKEIDARIKTLETTGITEEQLNTLATVITDRVLTALAARLEE